MLSPFEAFLLAVGAVAGAGVFATLLLVIGRWRSARSLDDRGDDV